MGDIGVNGNRSARTGVVLGGERQRAAVEDQIVVRSGRSCPAAMSSVPPALTLAPWRSSMLAMTSIPPLTVVGPV